MKRFQVPPCYHSQYGYVIEALTKEDAENLVQQYEWEYCTTYNIGFCPLVEIVEITE